MKNHERVVDECGCKRVIDRYKKIWLLCTGKNNEKMKLFQEWKEKGPWAAWLYDGYYMPWLWYHVDASETAFHKLTVLLSTETSPTYNGVNKINGKPNLIKIWFKPISRSNSNLFQILNQTYQIYLNISYKCNACWEQETIEGRLSIM